MNATVNVICYKSKVLKNNEHPLMIRVTKDRKRKYLSLGISIHPNYWDFNKNKPKKNCPNKEKIEALILEKLKQYNSQIIEYKTSEKQFTASNLLDKVNNACERKTVGIVFSEQIERFKQEKRINYASSHKHLYNSLIKFNKHLDIYFTDIDIVWLRKYETWLRGCNLGENTIGIRIRTLRAIYNYAIEENIVKKEHYPFLKYKVSKLSAVTAKRALTKKQINLIVGYKSNNPYIQLAIDLFSFSYLMAGINFVDMAYLTKDNIIENRLVYTRKKTKKQIMLPLQSKVSNILDKYVKTNQPYLFPILSSFHKTEQQKINRVRKVIKKINAHLKQIGKELNIPIDLTTYVARHSYATVLKRAGVSTSIICESLGHSSEKVTQIYLDSFENSQIDAAMKNLL